MARKSIAATIAALATAVVLSGCSGAIDDIKEGLKGPAPLPISSYVVEVELKNGLFIDCVPEEFQTISNCDFETLRTEPIEGRERFPFIKSSTAARDEQDRWHMCVTELNTQVGQSLMCDPQPQPPILPAR